MNRFLDLIDQTPPIPGQGPGHFDFSNPDRLFPAAVSESRLRLWKPGDPIPARGLRLLFGTATWSGYDMHLLDVIDQALAEKAHDAPTVEVFNAGNLTSVEDFEKYIPGLEAHHTPVLGIWQDGRLVERQYGYHAGDRLARMFGTSADAIVEFVRRLQAARAS
jgi:hypothetical protein